MAMRRLMIISAAAAVLLAGALAAALTFQPVATRAASPLRADVSDVALGRCPKDALPLPAEAVARAADQARIQAPAL
jgi:hypothetical protein